MGDQFAPRGGGIVTPSAAGSLMVRNPLAAAGWTPASLPNLVAWYDASNAGSITASGGKVSQWSDLSGANNHFTQATGGNQPSTGVATINSLNAIHFDGETWFMQSPLPANPAASSYFAAMQFNSIAGTQDLISWDNNSFDGGLEWQIASGTWTLNRGNTGLIGTGTTGADTSAHVTGITRVDGGSYAFYLDGASNGSGTQAGTWPHTMATRIGSGSTPKLVADVGELVICSSVLSGADITNLCSYLKTKWGTP